jgi:hypothetical protein
MTTSSRRSGIILGSVGLVLVTAACSSAGTSTTPSSRSSSARSMTSRPSTMPSPTVTAGLLTVTGRNTELTLASSTATALKNAGVQVTPASPATAMSSGALSFPITGGALTKAGLKGRLEHSGGLTFKHAGRSVTVTSFVLSTTTGLLTGTANGKKVPLLDVSFAKMGRTGSGSQVTLSGITSTLNAAAAVLLDGKLLVTTFKKGQPIGTLTANVTTGESSTSSPPSAPSSSSSG